MYVELQEAFGWEAYQKVFAEYPQLSVHRISGARITMPKSGIMDVRFSRTSERTLARSFKLGGFRCPNRR